MRPRILASTALLGLIPVLAFVPATQAPSPAGATPPGSQVARPHVHQDKEDSAKTCAMCHKKIYSEWKDRKHAHAWVDEIYQAKIKKKKRPKMCHSCHIPDSVLARLGRKPKTRKDKDSLHEGVTCVACHKSEGKIHGPFGAKTDAHESVKNPLFLEKNSSSLCMSCHSTKIDVVLPVGRDFKKAKLAEKGKSCVGCHMPEVTRHLSVSPVSGKPVGEKRKGRSHAILGPNDAEFCASAFKLTAKKGGGNLVLHIENEAGHRVPGLTTRAFHFTITQLDAKGKSVAENKLKIDSDNGLKVLETRQFPFALAAGATHAQVVIQHHFMGKDAGQVSKQKLPIK